MSSQRPSYASHWWSAVANPHRSSCIGLIVRIPGRTGRMRKVRELPGGGGSGVRYPWSNRRRRDLGASGLFVEFGMEGYSGEREVPAEGAVTTTMSGDKRLGVYLSLTAGIAHPFVRLVASNRDHPTPWPADCPTHGRGAAWLPLRDRSQ